MTQSDLPESSRVGSCERHQCRSSLQAANPPRTDCNPRARGRGPAWDSFVRVAQRSASASRPGRTASEKREMRHWTRRHRQVEGHEKRGPRWRRRFGVMMSRGARQPKQQNGWVGSKREAQGGDDGSSDTGWGWLGSDRLSLACRKDGHTFFNLAAKEKANPMPSSALFCRVCRRPLSPRGRYLYTKHGVQGLELTPGRIPS